MNDKAFAKKGFFISTEQYLLDRNEIFDFLNERSYWAKGIARQQMEKAISNSLCFGVYLHNKQAGFARVVTDKATFAYLCDVFILEKYRGLGLSKWLLQNILEHPDLQGLRRWSLATADAHLLYRQFGFKQITKPERWMEIFTPYKLKTEDTINEH